MTISSALSQYFPVILAIVGTIAIALGGLSKYRETRAKDMLEATTTWKTLAESRQAALVEIRERCAMLERQLAESREQAAYYWKELHEAGVKLPPRKLEDD
jgi:hypothetical protein